jgi:hypothetical protein
VFSRQIGHVFVDEQLIENLGGDTVDAAVGQLRLTGSVVLPP